MSRSFFLVLLAVLIKTGFGLDCTQIPSTSVFAGNTVHLPEPSDQLQIIPANFNCLYKINVPGNSTYGLSANVIIRNGIRGVNDYITVVDILGRTDVLNNKNLPLNTTYSLIPGAEMTIQVVTRSVYMQSMVEITVEYSSVQIGPTFRMKTAGEMNYIDVASLRDGKSLFNTVTFLGTEPIYMTYALPKPDSLYSCLECFVVDGTVDNHTKIHRFLEEIDWQSFTTKSNAVTILSSCDEFLGLVFNPKSEADKLSDLCSLAVNASMKDNGADIQNLNGKPSAVQVVNFETSGIIMDWFYTWDKNCTAYVVSGPPNNSSKVLLDLSNSPEMPHFFDVNYLSVVAVDCKIDIHVSGCTN